MKMNWVLVSAPSVFGLQSPLEAGMKLPQLNVVDVPLVKPWYESCLLLADLLFHISDE